MQPLIDRGALHAALLQEVLADALEPLGEYRWEADMQERKLWFISQADENNRVTTDVELVASIAPGPRSVLWGWAHPAGSADGAASQLREIAVRDGIAELTADEVAFPDDFDAQNPDDIAALAHEIGILAVGGLGRGPYFSAAVGGGSRAVLLLSAPVAQITLNDAVIKLPRILATGLLRDARTSIWSLAVARGWDFAWADNFTQATVQDSAATAVFTFDDTGRVARIAGGLRASAE